MFHSCPLHTSFQVCVEAGLHEDMTVQYWHTGQEVYASEHAHVHLQEFMVHNIVS